MKNNFKKLYNLLLKSELKKSDAVIWLHGDRFDRVKKVLEIYKTKFAKLIVISGNDILIGPNIRPGENNISISEMKKYLIKNKVSAKDIILDDKSLNTKEQSINMIKLARKKGWKSITIVSSAYNQPRAFLTFIKAAQTADYKGEIINQSVNVGEDNISSGRIVTNKELMKDEIIKIRKYQSKGDVASYGEGFKYLKKHKFDNEIIFREATISDVGILLKWRNDVQTRKYSKNTKKISKEEHMRWMKASLKNNNRKIYIIENKGVPVGTVRTDYLKGVTELSWTVSPKARGNGFGKEMVLLIADLVDGPIKAEVKIDNEASKHIAEFAGMKISREKDGVLYYSRSVISRLKNK